MAGRRLCLAGRKKLGKKKKSKPPQEDQIWCHLCKSNFKDYEVFRLHIMQKHRPTSQFYEGDSDSGSNTSQESERDSDVDDLHMDFGEKYDYKEASEAPNYSQNLKNISETAVSPQSGTLLTGSKGKKNLLKVPQNKFDQPEGNKASEQVDQSSPQISHNVNYVGSPQLNPVMNTYPQFVMSNNQLYANPYIQQPLMNAYFGGNQPVLQYQPMTNPSNVVQPANEVALTFNAKNIIQWYNKLKRICKPLKNPLSKQHVSKIDMVQRAIFDNLHLVAVLSDAEKHAILKVYQELNEILDKNTVCADEQL